MHIHYSRLLPHSKKCEHHTVTWETFEPKDANYIKVSVSCQDCPATVKDVRIEKDN